MPRGFLEVLAPQPYRTTLSGRLGEKPTHPELLDFRAARFVEQGWSVKEMIAFLVRTRAYQMSSAPSPRALEVDPANDLLSHFRVKRLEAEAIRDSLLAVSGELQPKMGGPSDEDSSRRSIYLKVRRTNLNPFLQVFDAPKPFTTLGRRDATNVPAQSLAMLNSPFVIAQAARWAATLAQDDSPTAEARVRRMFDAAFARPPADDELAAGAVARALQTEGLFNAIHQAWVFKVDCIVRKSAPFRVTEFARRQRLVVAGCETWVVSKEDLILSKLCWGNASRSEYQARDIKNLLATGCDRSYLLRWGAVFAPAKKGAARAASAAAAQVAADPASLQVPAGFKVELLYTVPKEEQGSWVGITVDAQGRLITCDQYGGLFRVTPPALGSSTGTKVEALAADIQGAHGLLFAHDSLYVVVDEGKVPNPREQGLYRLNYRAKDDAYDAPVLLRKFQGSGEHGPHSIVPSPDGKSLYVVNGNHTKPPEVLEHSRPVAWDEDQLVPRLWDANGHAKGILAPGGYILKTDPEGRAFELFTIGFRNQFDVAIDPNGELFTYDADMEWDIGSPWYRPTRINHCTSGGEAGWRSGAGKWPTYYPDSQPAVIDIGPGSPTGTVFGTGAKFPAKYQRAMYALDWTYGTMWAIHFTPDGASFRAEKEEFVAGKALPLTDAIIHPQDGAMYFMVGGRKTQSALYRVTYTGAESTAPAAPVAPTAEAKLRRELEKLHEAGAGPEAIEKAWPYLAHKDRFVRFAARVAIERQPVAPWAERALAEKNPQAAIEALIALSRVGRSAKAAEISLAEAAKKTGISSNAVPATLPEDAALQERVLEAISRIDRQALDRGQHLALLRALELCFTRFGKPAPVTCTLVAAQLDPHFPSTDPDINRELVALLSFLDSKSIVAKTVPLLDTARDEGGELTTAAVLARNEGYAHAVASMKASRPNRQAFAK